MAKSSVEINGAIEARYAVDWDRVCMERAERGRRCRWAAMAVRSAMERSSQWSVRPRLVAREAWAFADAMMEAEKQQQCNNDSPAPSPGWAAYIAVP